MAETRLNKIAEMTDAFDGATVSVKLRAGETPSTEPGSTSHCSTAEPAATTCS